MAQYLRRGISRRFLEGGIDVFDRAVGIRNIDGVASMFDRQLQSSQFPKSLPPVSYVSSDRNDDFRPIGFGRDREIDLDGERGAVLSTMIAVEGERTDVPQRSNVIGPLPGAREFLLDLPRRQRLQFRRRISQLVAGRFVGVEDPGRFRIDEQNRIVRLIEGCQKAFQRLGFLCWSDVLEKHDDPGG